MKKFQKKLIKRMKVKLLMLEEDYFNRGLNLLEIKVLESIMDCDNQRKKIMFYFFYSFKKFFILFLKNIKIRL